MIPGFSRSSSGRPCTTIERPGLLSSSSASDRANWPLAPVTSSRIGAVLGRGLIVLDASQTLYGLRKVNGPPRFASAKPWKQGETARPLFRDIPGTRRQPDDLDGNADPFAGVAAFAERATPGLVGSIPAYPVTACCLTHAPRTPADL